LFCDPVHSHGSFFFVNLIDPIDVFKSLTDTRYSRIGLLLLVGTTHVPLRSSLRIAAAILRIDASIGMQQPIPSQARSQNLDRSPNRSLIASIPSFSGSDPSFVNRSPSIFHRIDRDIDTFHPSAHSQSSVDNHSFGSSTPSC